MNKRSVFVGASVLTFGAVLSKMFGGIYRLALTGILGSEGIGIYQLVFPVFSLLLVVSTSGIPLAVSKLIAGCNASNDINCKKKILKSSMLILGIISLLFALILTFLSEHIAALQGNIEMSTLYIILAPSLVFVSITAVLRGYFQGENLFAPTAINQIVEQLSKVLIGIVASLILIKKSLMHGIMGAIVAITISEIVAFLFMLFTYFKHKKDKTTEKAKIDKEILKAIFNTALPITLTSVLLPLANFVDSLLVVNLLKNNFDITTATKLYGLETGVVGSVISIPNMFSFALASALLPMLTVSFSQKNKEDCGQIISMCSKINLIICIPCALGCMFFSKELVYLLYGTKFDSAGFEGLKIASGLLTIGSLGIFYFGFLQIYSVSLQAINKRFISVINLLIAVLVKMLFEVIFLPDPNFGIYALTIANIMCYGIAMLLNYIALKRYVNFSIPFYDVSKVIVSSLATLVTIYALNKFLTFRFGFAISLAAGVLVYLICLFVFKIFKKQELNVIFGAKQK